MLFSSLPPLPRSPSLLQHTQPQLSIPAPNLTILTFANFQIPSLPPWTTKSLPLMANLSVAYSWTEASTLKTQIPSLSPWTTKALPLVANLSAAYALKTQSKKARRVGPGEHHL